jgi:pyridoxal/pyridoxine/pyridoxamine kinase
MGRREFIRLLGGTGHLAASALAQHAQERDKVYQGYLGGSQSVQHLFEAVFAKVARTRLGRRQKYQN